jgi:hypothetical protein
MENLLLRILVIFCCNFFAVNSVILEIPDEYEAKKPAEAEVIDPLGVDVQAALDHFAKTAPDFHKDCLRVWKNFKKGINPHYSYRSWGSNFILWLRNERNLTFASQAQVGDVFAILHRKGLISKHAVLVLTANVWSYLVYREGIPDIEKQDIAPKNNKTREIML